jgi:hypothetical protein
MIRAVVIGSALLSPFLFPAPVTFVLSFFAGLFVPLVPLLSGAILEFLYGAPGVSLPVALIAGAFLSMLAMLVRGFIKTRIMWSDA